MITAMMLFPDTRDGVLQYLKMSLRQRFRELRFDQSVLTKDPTCRGVWTLKNATRTHTIRLAGYATPDGSVRDTNEFDFK